MKNILIIGAGRSASSLIKYVLEAAKNYNWIVTVADKNPDLAQKQTNNHPYSRFVWLDVTKPNDRTDLIRRVDLVVSLLPAHLHIKVARDCIRLNKHLITASYVSNEMYELSDAAKEKSLIFMGEMGLDPGIDHMSAKSIIDTIKEKGGKIESFRSYTGGLIAPESDDNPWHYKFTWNPRNVVLAGQGTAQYIEKGKYKYIPYHHLFKRYHQVEIEDFGLLEAYPNRDSLLYRDIYGLGNIPNLLRATLRYKGFCRAWNALVQLGLTDASFPILESEGMTYSELIDALVESNGSNLKERVASYLDCESDDPIIGKLEWLGLFSKRRIQLSQATPAGILEDLLLKKWELNKNDKDLIIMQHEFEYILEGERELLKSTLVMKGETRKETAMSKLVGLPMGIFVKQVMLGMIKTPGVQIPVQKEVYQPVLKELEKYDVTFKERIYQLEV